MDTAGTLQPQTRDADDEVVADALIEQVLHHIREFTHAAPITSVTLCFLAGIGAAKLWSITHR
ncbi:MAG: hypothetical protein ACXU8U_02540 [Asticcacaulis sp.]